MPRGRRPESVRPIVYSVKLVLRPGVDDDLIDYLHSAGPRLRATLVKLAMRNGQAGMKGTTAAAEEELSFDGLMQ
mgnify:CR=1 FL=1